MKCYTAQIENLEYKWEIYNTDYFWQYKWKKKNTNGKKKKNTNEIRRRIQMKKKDYFATQTCHTCQGK